MYNHYEYLINNFIRDTNSKEKIWQGLEQLKKKGVDTLDENFKGVSLYSLNNHIFKHLMKSPSEEQKEYLKKLWEFKDGTMQSLLRYRCEDSSFGRSLLKNVDSQVRCFERVINHSTLRELNDFLKENPRFFYNSPKLDLYRHPLRKMLLCEAAGMEISNKTVLATVSQDKLKDPAKLFNFISRYKKNLPENEWDNLIKIMLRNADTINSFSRRGEKNEKIGDVYFLIKQLYDPKSLEVNRFYSSNLIYESPNNIYFDPKNKNMTKEQIDFNWIESIKLLNTESLIRSNSWDHAKDLLENETIINIINKELKYLIINKDETQPDKNAGRWPLFYYPQYSALFKNEVFQPIIKELIFNECTVDENHSFYEVTKGNAGTHKRLETYAYYSKKMLDNPNDCSKIISILAADYNSKEFKGVDAVVKLEHLLPEKEGKTQIRSKI